MAAAPADSLADIRPRLRRDVLYARTADGVVFHHADGGLRFTGGADFTLAARVVPQLTGGARLADICAGFPEEQRLRVRELIAALLDHGLARDHRPAPAAAGPAPAARAPRTGEQAADPPPADPPAADPPPARPRADGASPAVAAAGVDGAPPGAGAPRTVGAPAAEPLGTAVREHFAAQLAWLDQHAGDAERRFAAFRSAPVTVLGGGELAGWCVLSLLRGGSARIATEQEPDERVHAEAADLAARGCPAELARIPAGGVLPAGRADGGGGATGPRLLVVTGADAAARSHRLLAAGLPGHVTLLPVWTFGERVVIGPRSDAGAAGCFSCALLRLGGAVDAGAAAEVWREIAAEPDGPAVGEAALPGRPPRGPAAAMAGNLVGYEIFRALTGTAEAGDSGPAQSAARQVLIQDPASLDVVAETILPHPRCRLCAPAGPPPPPPAGPPPRLAVPPAATAESVQQDDGPPGELLRTSAALVRPHTGVFTRFDDEDLVQSPLRVTRLEVPLTAGGPRRIAAFDVHHLAGARQRALRAAAAVYVDHTVPAVPARPGPDAGTRVAPHRLAAAEGDGRPVREVAAWAEAVSLLTGARAQVPLAAARPFGAHNRERLVPPTRGGTGAGWTPGEAAGRGLLSALALDALRRALGGAEVTRLEPCPPDGDPAAAPRASALPELIFLTRCAAHLAVRVELLDLGEGGHSSAQVVLAREITVTGPPRWAVGCALDRASAAVAALRDLLGTIQLAGDPSAAPPGAGPGAVDAGDPFWPGLDARVLTPVGPAPPVAASGTGFDRIRARLRAAGRDALLLPTTPADLALGGLHTARVLLTDDGDRVGARGPAERPAPAPDGGPAGDREPAGRPGPAAAHAPAERAEDGEPTYPTEGRDARS